MSFAKLVETQKTFFKKGSTLSYRFRANALKKLRTCLKKHEREIYEALKSDLNKPEFEAFVGEIGFILKEIDFVIKHLKGWMEPEKVPTELVNQPAKSYIHHQPYGVCLIISPWNYPFHLSFMPLIGAIAAGNTAILKPSEYSPHSSYLIKRIIDECFDESYIACITGDKEVAQKLLEIKFDKIFYTGNSQIGRLVMEKATKYLTPVTLELGGKSPAIVLSDARLNIAAKRIVWGKFFNAGQTCVAVDYVAVEKAVYPRLTKLIVKYTKKLANMRKIKRNYAKIINRKHFDRLMNLINSSRIIFSSGYDEKELFIYPTIVEANPQDAVMEDEIFGPILPLVRFESYDEIREFVLSRPKPLAAYFFTESAKNKERLLKEIPSGGVTINDTLIHLSSSHLPFGGMDESGMGTYHGMHSFLEFSQKRAVVDRSTLIDIPLRYPPYEGKLTIVKSLY